MLRLVPALQETRFFLCIALLCTLHLVARAKQPPDNDLCTPLNRSVVFPVRIRLIFAGAAPLFLREPATKGHIVEAQLLKHLSGTVRHRALPFEDETSPIAAHLRNPVPDPCSVVEYRHQYEVSYATEETAAALDRVLSGALAKASSMYACGTNVADQFWDIIKNTSDDYRENDDPNVYDFLVYNAGSVAPQRGYQSEPGAPIGTIGVASKARFAFLDVDARPFFLDNSGSSTPGEDLMVSSKTPATYAAKMRSIVRDLFTPQTSPHMRRFPHESRLLFTLRQIDVSAVLGRMSGYGGDSLGNRAIGLTFNATSFANLVRSALDIAGSSKKEVSVSVSTTDVDNDARMAMAVARSFSMKGLEMALDSERLLRDLMSTSSEGPGYFVDSSFVAHVPLYLFSFADDSRITHFDSTEELRAKVVQKEAVFMVENRLHDEVSDHTSTTSEAAKEVLELLGGVGRESLGHMNARDGVIPLLLRDIINRNVMTRELDWSQASAARKAVELLNFEGLDSRFIPHEEGSAIEESRQAVRKCLLSLYDVWDHFAVKDVERAMEELVQKSEDLANKLHEEICNQPLPEEIMLKVEAESDEGGRSKETRSLWFYGKWVGVSSLAGIACGIMMFFREKRKSKTRGSGIGEIPIVSPRHHFEVPATGLWFSTLTASDKPKLN